MTLSATTLRALTTSVYVFSACLVVGFIALVVVLSLDSSYEPSQSLASSLPDVLILLAFVLVGLVVTLKRPENLVGWALLLAGLGLLLGGVLGAYAELALLAKPEADLPAGPAAGSISRGSWAPLMAGVFLLLIVFPSGALPSRALRRFAALVLLGFALIWAILSTVPGELEPPLENFDNPLAFTSSSTYVVAVFPIIFACLGSIVVAAVIVVRRFRRSRGQERLQFKWVTASAGLLIVTLPIGAAFNWTRVAGAIMTIQLIALPVSVGIAVLRYRLYEIDIIIRRTLVYSTLSALLAGMYLAFVLGLQALFASFAGGSNLAIAGSTLVVAALFLPVRGRVQRFVDRRFYRRRYDAQRTLDGFGIRLRQHVDFEMLTDDLRGVVQETMQPAHASVWLREGAR